MIFSIPFYSALLLLGVFAFAQEVGLNHCKELCWF